MTQKTYEGSASAGDVKQALEVVKGLGQMALAASGVDLGDSEIGAISGAVDDAIQPGTTIEVHVARGGDRRVLVRFAVLPDPPLEIGG